jgi:predicted RNase H-like HicB family nuclease
MMKNEGAGFCSCFFRSFEMLLNTIIEKDESGYFAHIPQLKGCVSQGKTYEETLVNIKEAAELYLESLEKEELILFENQFVSIASIEVSYSRANLS